jgi:hypothetical protein
MAESIPVQMASGSNQIVLGEERSLALFAVGLRDIG